MIGFFAPVITPPSPAARSVMITWTQPEFSREVTGYSITVAPGDNAGTCSFNEENRPASTQPNVLTTTFSDLEEFRNYVVTVVAGFSPGLGVSNPTAQVTMNFATPIAGMPYYVL